MGDNGESKIAIGNIDLPEKEMTDSNFIADQLPEGFVQLKRIDGTRKHPPKIKWGKVYREEWSDRQKLAYAEKLAYAMNHAADLAQREKDEAVRLLNRKERQLKATFAEKRKIEDVMRRQTLGSNAEKQTLQRRIVEQDATIKDLERANESLRRELERTTAHKEGPYR